MPTRSHSTATAAAAASPTAGAHQVRQRARRRRRDLLRQPALDLDLHAAGRHRIRSGGHGVAQRGHQAAPERGAFAAARATLDVRMEANALRRIQARVDRVDEARLDVGAAQLGHETPPDWISAATSGRCFSRRSMCRRASCTRTFTALVEALTIAATSSIE